MQAAPQLHAVAFGPSGVAAGLPEQDEVARSQLHDHGFGWFAHRLFWGLAQCALVYNFMNFGANSARFVRAL